MKPASSFTAITSEGGLLPADFLAELLLPEAKTPVEGLTPASYNLAEGERISEQVNRSWNRLKGRWTDFKKAIADKRDRDSTTTETRERWLQPLFQELGFGQKLPSIRAIDVNGRSYPVSHGWNHVPIHLVGSHLDIDLRTPGAVGAAKSSPHSLVQQVLNASEGHLWGIVSNGLVFRLLRDSVALTRMSYVEWDLAAVFDGDLYSEFFILWLVAHQSRFDAERAELCWLEKWKKSAEDKGLRALEKLYPGVKTAITSLGAGIVSHSANTELREKLRSGVLTTQEFYRQVLRVIYRLLFLLVAEERGLLHPPDESAAGLKARRRYLDFYSITRLRALTLYRAGTPHPDLWQVFQFVTGKLGADTGCSELALPALGSFLWTVAHSTPDLLDSTISNHHFLEAVHALAFVFEGNVRRGVDYKNLGSEELGSVYQGLLELHPQVNAAAGTFVLETASGNERKTTGSFYTPDSLVQCLLESALEPLIAERLATTKTPEDREAVLLSLKVCDPSVGSGHFILRAGHRIAKHLARVRSGEEEPSPGVYRTALRDVIGRCLYGVDINPMAVELCRVSLWLETVDPGKPLGFLNHHIRTGNSLLGTTPDLIAGGLPDDTFTAIEGDDKLACAELKKRNKKEREGFGPLFQKEEQTIRDRLRQAATAIEAMDDSQPDALHRKEAAFASNETAPEYRHAKLLADLWCAAFVIKKQYPPIEEVKSAPSPVEGHLLHTQDELFGLSQPGTTSTTSNKKQPGTRNQEHGPPFGITTGHLRNFVQGKPLPADLQAEVKALARQYRFFHWHLAFPQVFDQGGFDCMLGNPPWERPKPEPAMYFASKRPEIANAQTSALRDILLKELAITDSQLFHQWLEHERFVLGAVQFQTASGAFPHSAVGKFNLGNTFVERSRSLLCPLGRAGLLNVSGLATDDSGKEFIADLMRTRTLVSFFDFENREALFHSIHRSYKFSAITIAGSSASGATEADFVFFAQNIDDLNDPDRHIQFSAGDIELLNPISGNCPVFRERPQAEIVKALYRRAMLREPTSSVLWDWNAEPTFLYVMSDHSDLFATRGKLGLSDFYGDQVAPHLNGTKWLPLYESKMFHQFEHRWASLDTEGNQLDFSDSMHHDPLSVAVPRYWMRQTDTTRKLDEIPSRWLIAVREVTNATNERTAIATVLPKYPVGHNAQVFNFRESASSGTAFLATLNSLVLDFAARTKIGGSHLSSFILRQLPILPSKTFAQPCPWATIPQSHRDWLLPRVLELTYTAWDLEAFAADCGWKGPPFRWDGERRFLLRCELDAAFFHLYLGPQEEWQQQPEALTRAFPSSRHAVSYIMDTFPIVRRKDEAKYNGHYRTKEAILQIYDALTESMRSGVPYQTLLTPPPADPSCCHPVRTAALLPVITSSNWQDAAFKLLAPQRSKVCDYSVIVWPELLRQLNGPLDFEMFRKAYWLLSEPVEFERQGRKLFPDVPSSWWKSRNEALEKLHFLPALKGYAILGDLKIWRENGVRKIRWTGDLGPNPIPEAVDDARIALQIADQWEDDTSDAELAAIESLLLTLETT